MDEEYPAKLNRHIRVTLGRGRETWTREFRGDLRYQITRNGHLSICESKFGIVRELISFGRGQWIAAEYADLIEPYVKALSDP